MKRIFSIDVGGQRKSLINQFKKTLAQPIIAATVGGDGKSVKGGKGGLVTTLTKMANTAVRESRAALNAERTRLNKKLPKALKAKVKQFEKKMQQEVLGNLRAEATREGKALYGKWRKKIEKQIDEHHFGAARQKGVPQSRLERKRKEAHIETRLKEELAKFCVAYVKKAIKNMPNWAKLSEWHLIQKEWAFINAAGMAVAKSGRVSKYTRKGNPSIRYGFSDKNATAFEQLVPMLGLASLDFDAKDAYPNLRSGNVSFSSPQQFREIPKDVMARKLGFDPTRRDSITASYASPVQPWRALGEPVVLGQYGVPMDIPVPMGYEDIAPHNAGRVHSSQQRDADRRFHSFQRRVSSAMARGQFPRYTQGQRANRSAYGPRQRVLQDTRQRSGQLSQVRPPKGDYGPANELGTYEPFFVTPGQKRDIKWVMADKLKETKGKHNIYYFFKVWPQYRPGLYPYFFKPARGKFAGAGARAWKHTIMEVVKKSWKSNLKSAIASGRGASGQGEAPAQPGGSGGSRAPKNLGQYTEKTGDFLDQLIKSIEDGLREGHKLAYQEAKAARAAAEAKRKAEELKRRNLGAPAPTQSPLAPPHHKPMQPVTFPQDFQLFPHGPPRRKGRHDPHKVPVKRTTKRIRDLSKGRRRRRRRRPRG